MAPEHHHSPLLATAGSVLASLGMVDTVREHVHALAGIVGDLGGMAITLLTLGYWLKVWGEKRQGGRGKDGHRSEG